MQLLFLQIALDQQVVFDILEDLHLRQKIRAHGLWVDQVLVELLLKLRLVRGDSSDWVLRAVQEHVVDILEELGETLFNTWLEQKL